MFTHNDFGKSNKAPCPCWQNLLSSVACATCLHDIKNSLLPRSISFQLESKLKLYAMSEYTPVMKHFIYSCKSAAFNGLMPTQKNILKELCAFWSAELKNKKIDLVTAIPGHPIRSRMQTDLAWFLARYLSRSLGLSEPSSILKRKLFVKDRVYKAQKSLTRHERKHAIQQQYFIPAPSKEALRVCLIDDVCTTGSTLLLCKTLLETRGYKVNSALVLSKVHSPQY